MLDDNELLFDELYEKTKDCGRVQFINLLMEKEREIKELKKRLEKKYEKVGTLTRELLYEENTKLINQQKKFIEYLENEIKRLENTEFYIESMQKAAIATHKHNLSKYKEIIGVKDEKVNC